MAIQLTRNMRRVLKRFSNLWIHVYHQVLLDRDLLVPGLNSLLDPVRKVLTSDSVCNIYYPLPRKFWPLLLHWKESFYLRVLTKKASDIVDEETFVSMDRKGWKLKIRGTYWGICRCWMSLYLMYFFSPDTRSFRKYMVTCLYSGRYALTSSVRNV